MKNDDNNLSEIRREAGKIGGSQTSEAKTEAARENGKKGGRPRKYKNASERQKAYLERKKLAETEISAT